MRLAQLALYFSAATLVACSSSSSSPGGGGEDAGASDAPAVDTDGGADDAAPDSGAVDKTSWTYIYGAYFAAGTPGHCGNAGCHQTVRQGFRCGTDKTTCYNGLVAAKLIGTTAATQPLVDPNLTPLAWFNSGGSMPEDKPVTNTTAAAELKAWVAAGAKND